MLGGRRWWFAAVAASVAFAVLPGAAHANGEPDNLSILVLGDSYSSGNGAGSYSGTPSCRRSSSNYARQFEQLVEADPGGTTTTVNTVACSGAVTADIERGRDGRPAQVTYANGNDDVVFISIGGNDVGFGSIVSSCLLLVTRDAGRCDAELATAEQLVSDGTLASRLTSALGAIRAHVAPTTRIVLVGYPYLEGDSTYTVPSTRPGVAPVDAGARVRALTDAGERVGEAVVARLNDAQGTNANLYVSTKGAFAGHELLATRPNPQRWFVAPWTDAPLGEVDVWYHPNRAGHAAEAKLLFDDPRVPRGDVRG